jgi:hypothetical protein
MNRKLKRAEKAYHKREAKKGSWLDPLIDGTEGYKDKLLSKNISPENLMAFGHNKVLSIMLFEYEDMVIMGFRRNTSDTDIPWSIKYHWKNELGYDNLDGYEVYPVKEKLIDQANMYWLMIPRNESAKIDLNAYKLFPDLVKGIKDDCVSSL